MPELSRIFFSYPHSERAFASLLAKSLSQQGLVVDAVDAASLDNEGERVDQLVRAADDVLLLINSQSKLDEAQQRIWRSVLATAWTRKLRIIPVLWGDAELPPFVRSATQGAPVQAIRLQGEEDLDRAVEAVRAALRPKTFRIRLRPAKSEGSFRQRLPPGALEVYSPSSDADRRRERLAEIRGFVEQQIKLPDPC